MKIFQVGGAVRDSLLGVPPKDRDWIIVDTTESELLEKGFQKVGLGFPVFLHPITREEHVLLEDGDLRRDLERRDLTINAMAIDESGALLDYFGGQNDLQQKILRHTSASFEEDPLRVLRVARFRARYPEFSIAPETMSLMRQIAGSIGYQAILSERIFTELRLALKSARPSVFFEVLKSVNALKPHFKELNDLIDVPQRALYHPEGDCWTHTMLVLDQAATLTEDLPTRFAALVHDLGKGVTPKKILPKHIAHEENGLPLVKDFSSRLRVPNDWLESALVVTKFHLRVHRLREMKASTIVRMFYEMDAFRKPHLVEILALACEADNLGKLRPTYEEGALLRRFFKAAQVVRAGDLVSVFGGAKLGEAIREERIKAVKSLIASEDRPE